MFFNQYPYLNLNDFNLDYILKTLKTLSEQLDNFISLNTIKYANPIQWNITKQYETNTVVIDANDGTAYLSVKPVPTGVAITNTDYWTPIFTLNLLSANQNITLRDDGANVLATFASAVDDWLIWNNTLYKVTRAIAVNEAYVVGYNLTRYTVKLFINDYIQAITNLIGDLDDLNTSDKTSIVNAINENTTNITNLATIVSGIRASFLTVADMIASNKIVDGEVYRCDGYYVAGDQGFGFWKAQSTADSNFSIATDNGLYMIPIAIDGIITANQFGCYGDDDHDDTTNIQNGINFCAARGLTFKFVHGIYKITDTIIINKGQFSVIGIGATDNCAVKGYGTLSGMNAVFRFNGYPQHSLTFGDFTIVKDTKSGIGLLFGDTSISAVAGMVYGTVFKPLTFNNLGYGIAVQSGASAFWGCIFEKLIFGSNITISIDMSGSIAGIPNNRFESITTYNGLTSGLHRSPNLNMHGYNQIIENLEMLDCGQTCIAINAGGRLTINNFKIEHANYANGGTTYLIYLNPYSHLNITEISMSGDFTNVTSIIQPNTTADSVTESVIINGTFRFDNEGTDSLQSYTNYVKTDVDYITSGGSAIHDASPNYDNYLKLKSISDGSTLYTTSNADVDLTRYARVIAGAAVTINIPKVINRYMNIAPNINLPIINTSAGAVAITIEGVAVGSVPANSTGYLVCYSGSYHVI